MGWVWGCCTRGRTRGIQLSCIVFSGREMRRRGRLQDTFPRGGRRKPRVGMCRLEDGSFLIFADIVMKLRGNLGVVLPIVINNFSTAEKEG
jgi:hypothetical protein